METVPASVRVNLSEKYLGLSCLKIFHNCNREWYSVSSSILIQLLYIFLDLVPFFERDKKIKRQNYPHLAGGPKGPQALCRS